MNTDIEIPRLVYKYRDWSKPKHQTILTKQELYFASYKSCKYKYEHNLEFDFTYDIKDVKKRFELIYDRGNNKSISKNEYVERAFQNFRESEEAYRPKLIEEYSNLFNKERGIFCTSLNKNNIDLWKEFANEFSGFAIGIDPKFLIQSNKLEGLSKRVEYYDLNNPPKIKISDYLNGNNLLNTFKLIFSLPNGLIHEDEFRISKAIKNNERTIKLNKNYIKQIILGFKMNEADKNNIKEVIRNEDLKVILYQQVKGNNGTFKYEEKSYL
jgi:hypothetical protein